MLPIASGRIRVPRWRESVWHERAPPIELPALPDRVPSARGAITRLCDHLELEDEIAGQIRLAVTEACTNCVLHAYDEAAPEDPSTFALEARVDDDALVVVVRDAGAGIARRSAHAGSRPRPAADPPGGVVDRRHVAPGARHAHRDALRHALRRPSGTRGECHSERPRDAEAAGSRTNRTNAPASGGRLFDRGRTAKWHPRRVPLDTLGEHASPPNSSERRRCGCSLRWCPVRRREAGSIGGRDTGTPHPSVEREQSGVTPASRRYPLRRCLKRGPVRRP